MKLEERQKEIIRNALKDYRYIRTEINYLIEKGRTLSEIYDYLRHINAIEFSNCDFTNKEFRYIDFFYYDISASVIDDEKGLRVQNSLQIYDKEIGEYIIEDWLTEKEWETILEKGEF